MSVILLKHIQKDKGAYLLAVSFLVIFPGKVKDSKALGIVTKVYPDGRGLVRKVTVRFRRKNVREAFNVCRSKMEEKDVAVQRLVLLVSSRQQSLL